MQIILLSSQNDALMWPLSNEGRAKQFIRLLTAPDGSPESPVQRTVRRLKEAGLGDGITLVLDRSQHDAAVSQLGAEVSAVIQPSRRCSFAQVCLACEYLAREKGCLPSEPVVAMPWDLYGDDECYRTVADMVRAVERGDTPLAMTGAGREGDRFARGVYAFRLGFMTAKAREFADAPDMASPAEAFGLYPDTGFADQVASQCSGASVTECCGQWEDTGSWDAVTSSPQSDGYGYVVTDGTTVNTHAVNELDIPLLCLGTKDIVIAASPDGILVADKSQTARLPDYAARLADRAMYEERRWGEYRVVDRTSTPDGFCSLTKRLTLRPGAAISYQRHAHRDEVWTFVDGHGEIVTGTDRRPVKRGDTVMIPAGTLHTLRAVTALTFVEVQTGSRLVESDIERFPYDWGD